MSVTVSQCGRGGVVGFVVFPWMEEPDAVRSTSPHSTKCEDSKAKSNVRVDLAYCRLRSPGHEQRREWRTGINHSLRTHGVQITDLESPIVESCYWLPYLLFP